MGCCGSNLRMSNVEEAYAIGEIAIPKRSPSAASTTSGSSGIYSAGTSTISLASSSSTKLSRSSALRTRPKFFRHRVLHKSRTEQCDPKQHSQTHPKELTISEKSFGYCSPSTSDSSSNYSTPSLLVHTAESDESDISMTKEDVDFEMCMMAIRYGQTTKTSTPAFSRRLILEGPSLRDAAPTSASFDCWRHYLLTTPSCALHNKTKLDEALTGNICASNFPAYTDWEDMESAPKRFKGNKDINPFVVQKTTPPTPTQSSTYFRYQDVDESIEPPTTTAATTPDSTLYQSVLYSTEL